MATEACAVAAKSLHTCMATAKKPVKPTKSSVRLLTLLLQCFEAELIPDQLPSSQGRLGPSFRSHCILMHRISLEHRFIE